jgi:metallo-beta-lactamase family protein
VIIAGSGMADGGRIVEHLFSGLSNRKNTVAFVGFQAEGTLGRDLTTGAKKVEIDRRKVQVRSRIEHLKGFSAHGDHNDYLEWIQRYKSSDLRKVFLIHAEVEKSKALRYDLNQDGIDSVIPCINDAFEI